MYSGSQESHALDRLAAVWSRRKWLAVAMFALSAAATVTVVLSLPNLYRATATVLVEQPRVETAPPAELETRLQIISQQILSRARLEALIVGLDLYPAARRGVSSSEGVVAQMRRDIRTEFKGVPQPSGLATIAFALSYRGADPATVARVANALASLYVQEDVRIRDQQASGTVEALKAQLEEVKRDLEQQERERAEFQDEHMGELPQQAEANLAALERLYEELRTTGAQKERALDRRDDLVRRLEAEADAPRASPDPGAARLARLKEELSELSQRFSDKYPEVIRVRAEVAALEQQAAGRPEPAAEGASGRLAQRLRQSLGGVEAEIVQLKADEGRLRAGIESYLGRLENAPRRQRSLQEISRDYETTRDLYDSLRKRYEQAQLEHGAAGGQSAPRFRILDPAVVPAGPVAPNRLVLLFMALVGSLAAAAGAVALAEWLDTSFHAADEVRSFTRVPVLASIPLIVTAGDRRARRRRFCLAAVSVVLAVGVVIHTFHGLARNQQGLVMTLGRS